ncbi:ABC transporter substrate-binding protein [Oerskovia sp. M15]
MQSFDGREVTVADASRIIAVDLYGTLGEIIYSLGLGANVVGRDLPTGFPEAADVPVVTGAGHALNIETILGLNPSVILTDATLLTDTARSQLESSGIPVVYFDEARTLDGIDDRITAVATTLGVPEAGRRSSSAPTSRSARPSRESPRTRATPRRVPVPARLHHQDAVRAGLGRRRPDPRDRRAGRRHHYRPHAAVRARHERGHHRRGPAGVPRHDRRPRVERRTRRDDGDPGLAQTPAGQNQRVIDMDGSRLLTFGPAQARPSRRSSRRSTASRRRTSPPSPRPTARPTPGRPRRDAGFPPAAPRRRAPPRHTPPPSSARRTGRARSAVSRTLG